MKSIQSIRVNLLFIFLFAMALACKPQIMATSAPFDIDEKTYFHWVGGVQGTQGTTINLVGRTKSLNVSFSKLYFQNNEYDIVPEFNSDGFVIRGNFSEFRKRDAELDNDTASENGNEPVTPEKKIPFDLEHDEAILLYTVNGLEGYHKISGIKQLEKFYRP